MPIDTTPLTETVSLTAIVLAFLGGIVTSIGPCNLLMAPILVGYIGGGKAQTQKRSFYLSLAFALGLAITFVLMGVIASLVGGLIGGTSRLWYYLVAFVCILIALQILGEFKMPAWFQTAGNLQDRIRLKGVPGALSLGLVSGLIGSQCATPVLAAIVTVVMAEGAVAYGALLLFVYALGRGLPIVLAGTFTGVVKKLSAAARWMPLVEKASGVVILLAGLYFLWIA